MYNLSTVGFSRSVCTLLDVLWLFRNDAHYAHLDSAEVSLSHAGQPMHVTKFNGRLTVRVSGAMRDIFLALIDEIDGQYFRPYGSQLQPWQIRRPHWKLLHFAFELSTEPLYLFSSDQVCDSVDGQLSGRALRLSQRYYELHRAMAALDHGRGTFKYANDFVRALEGADMQMLLDIVDRPDDQNRWTKMAIREHFGVKLIGLKAAARRRAIFALAGMSEAQQSQWEEGTKESRAAALMEREAERVKAHAATASYRDGVRIISGAQHVEQSIGSGFIELGRFWQGASCRYYLKNPQAQGDLRYLRAGDGTLAYAQSLLSKQPKQSA